MSYKMCRTCGEMFEGERSQQYCDQTHANYYGDPPYSEKADEFNGGWTGPEQVDEALKAFDAWKDDHPEVEMLPFQDLVDLYWKNSNKSLERTAEGSRRCNRSVR